jgi:ribonuclease E
VLDNEPDAEQTTNPAAASPPPRRRRAASRPAGPPAAAPAPTPVAEDPTPTPVAEEPTPTPAAQGDTADAPPPDGLEPATSTAPDPVSNPVADRLDALAAGTAPAGEPAAPEPAARPARRRTRKAAVPAATTEPTPDTEVPATPEAPVERPARRRTRKAAAPAPEAATPEAAPDALTPETAAPEVQVPEPAATEAVELDVLSVDEQVEAAPAVAEAGTVVLDTPYGETEVPADEAAAIEAVTPGTDDETPDATTTDAPAVDAEQDEDVVTAPVDDTDPSADDEAEDEDDEEDAEDDGASDTANDGGDGSRRRRRRRGGRRRRRTGDGEPGADDDTADTTEDAATSQADETTDASGEAAGGEGDAASEEQGDEQGEEGDGTRRRRRRRRRRGEEAVPAADDPTEVVVRVREPRKAKEPKAASSADDQVTGISGSTRMEAKRQRRREGRDAGRRRAPILSEAEFLARREAVTRRMIIRQRDDLTQIAVLEDDILVEHYVDRESATSLIGNVYLARVQNVLPSMEAAFVDIGRGRNAVIYAGEVDWDSFGAQGQNRKVEKVLKSGQTVLVQVTKDPVGAKGARLTNHVSIPGRYIVYAPSGHLSGISRKLPENERKRLKDILSGLVGEASVIVRTAAEGASEDELVRDVNRLKAQWSDIEKKVATGHAPQLLYGEPDLTVRIVRDLFTEDFSELIVSGNAGPDDAYDAIAGYVEHVAPHLADRLKRYEPGPDDGDDVDAFSRFRIDEQISKALERKVFLPSGGSLVIDRTEAMTVIDVNTGKFTGSGGNLEATVTSNNLEAAEEIVRQLRLRDVGGIIVIDFIDMVLPANRELLLRRLVECLGRDRTRHQVAEVTSLGLVQMTRKKIGTGLLEAFSSECPVCHGRGYEIHDEPVDSQRQADGGAREQRGGRSNAGSGSGGSGNGGSGNGGSGNGGNGGSGNGNGRQSGGGSGNGGSQGNGHDHGSGQDSGGSGRSGRSRGGRGRGRSDDAPEPTADAPETSGGTDPAIKAAVQQAIAEVAASGRTTTDEAGS